MSKYKVDINGLTTSSLKVLKAKEVRSLLKVYQQNNDEKAKEELIMGNLKLVLSLVQKFSKRTENMDDLFQVGCVGLIKAIENFDLSINVQFSTYAVPMIIGEIKRYLRDFSLVRISRNLRDISYKTLKAKESFINEYSREPTIEELSEILDIKSVDIQEAINSNQVVSSIFEPLYSNDGESISLIEQLKDNDDKIDKMNDYIALNDALEHLNQKERWIINQRYFAGKTQCEIAEELFVSQAQVSRMEKAALQRLKTNM
jgi:RNA polymerase sigma-70 factor, sigma-B/F/G subfamily